jgi:hypothetical protein
MYIGVKRNAWEEGALQNMSTNVLMTNAENHYKVRIQQGKWQAPTKKDEQILALKALLQEKEHTRKDNKDGKQDKKSREDKMKYDKERSHGSTYLQRKANQHRRKSQGSHGNGAPSIKSGVDISRLTVEESELSDVKERT